MTAISAGGTNAELDQATAQDLLRRAVAAREHAYAPYSGFRVGAALLAADGRIFTGVNVENASYGLTMCAERTAVVKGFSEGAREFVAIAVVGPDDLVDCPPCGACRQVLHEAGADLQVVTPKGGGDVRITPIGELLPGAFGPERLER